MAKVLLALVGPTAAGKSELAVALAPELGAEIVSCDSMQVYRGMDVGTAKPSPEDRTKVPHHLLDVADPGQGWSVALFQKLARAALEDIWIRGKNPFLVGGSGLYFRAVVDPLEFPGTDPGVRAELEERGAREGPEALWEELARLDPEAAARIHPRNLRRVVRALEVVRITGRPFSSFRRAWAEYRSLYPLAAAGILPPREVLARRVEERAWAQMTGGLVEEAKALLEMGVLVFSEETGVTWASRPGFPLASGQAIGYRQAALVAMGRRSLEEAVAETVRENLRYARRQTSWFRRDPRIRWFEGESPEGLRDPLYRFFRAALEDRADSSGPPWRIERR